MAFYGLTQTTIDMFNGRRPSRVNMTNRKPFRTIAQKREARNHAFKAKDGTWRTIAPVSQHREIPVGVK